MVLYFVFYLYMPVALVIMISLCRSLFTFLSLFAANAVLEGACERVIVGDMYCDIPLGLYVIRGENVVLIGELDVEKEELPPHMKHVSVAEIRRVSTSTLRCYHALKYSFVT